MRKSVVLVLAIVLAFAVPQAYGEPKAKPVEIVGQPIDVNIVNTEPLRVIIETGDVGAGVSVFKEGTCEVSSQQDYCHIVFYTVPSGKTFVATALFVEVENVNLVACIWEDSTPKACMPATQWMGPIPASIPFAGESEVNVQLRYATGTIGCSNGGCPENYRITLMGNLM